MAGEKKSFGRRCFLWAGLPPLAGAGGWCPIFVGILEYAGWGGCLWVGGGVGGGVGGVGVPPPPKRKKGGGGGGGGAGGGGGGWLCLGGGGGRLVDRI